MTKFQNTTKMARFFLAILYSLGQPKTWRWASGVDRGSSQKKPLFLASVMGREFLMPVGTMKIPHFFLLILVPQKIGDNILKSILWNYHYWYQNQTKITKDNYRLVWYPLISQSNIKNSPHTSSLGIRKVQIKMTMKYLLEWLK